MPDTIIEGNLQTRDSRVINQRTYPHYELLFSEESNEKRFSLRYKLILIFGLLIALGLSVEGFLAVYTARKAVTEKLKII